jgi:nitric-oxide synthase, bacterial
MTLRVFPRRIPQAAAAVLAEAETFLAEFYAACPAPGEVSARMAQVREAVLATGTYEHTPEELEYAARIAWRNAARCSGRDKWRTLRVRDCRTVSDPKQVADETVTHLRTATSHGRVRSWITVFAPDRPGNPGPRIINGQAVRYAGYRRPDGAVTGDPVNVALTDLAVSLGWRGRGGRFDVLPLIAMDGSGELCWSDVPPDAVLEVPISHPDFRWFSKLGLRWYAIPVITDMYLEAGGIRYPCAPFNGWYQASTEVGVRNLGDETRYNVLPDVARGMKLDMSSPSTFWMDRAAVELAVAVHHSYRRAGVVVTDHQAETRRFAHWAAREGEAGRGVPADWAWIVPPVSGSTTPVFHQEYQAAVLKPGYFRHEDGPLVSG